MVVNAFNPFNPSTKEAETGEVQSLYMVCLHSEFQANLNNILNPCLKKRGGGHPLTFSVCLKQVSN